jgi:hypothetical protein
MACYNSSDMIMYEHCSTQAGACYLIDVIGDYLDLFIFELMQNNLGK